MSDNQRDTQFHGFAKALWKEIIFSRAENVQRSIDDNIQLIEQIIARRAYDLAIEVAKQAIDGNSYDEERDARRILEKLGDMAELPKEQEG